MATVLVTGGTGYVGAYVAADLLAHSHDVIVYDVSTDTRILDALGIGADVTVCEGDVTDDTHVRDTLQEYDVTHIVHLAALLTNSARDNPRDAYTVNIGGTNTIFEAARALDDQIERVSWASSAAVYAPPHNYDDGTDWWVTEDDLVYPDTLYGATKEYNEHQARVYREDYDLELVGLRPTVAYGPYRETGGSAFLANIIEKPALGESFSVQYGDQEIDWQHVSDIAQSFRRGAFTQWNDIDQGIYNVRGELATVRDAVETMRTIMPDADLTVSDEGELPWTQRLDMTAAKRDLGYEPTYDLESGFRMYVNTLRRDAGLEPV